LRDTMDLNVFGPLSALNLGRDTLLCPNSSLHLIPPSFKNYKWQDGSSGNTFTVDPPGIYYLTANVFCGREYSDTINVQYSSISLDVGEDILICLGEERKISALGDFKNFLWQPNYNITNVATNAPVVFPHYTTSYTVRALDRYGCPVMD